MEYNVFVTFFVEMSYKNLVNHIKKYKFDYTEYIYFFYEKRYQKRSTAYFKSIN